MNRKLLGIVAVAAVAALLAGAAIGRNLLSATTPTAKSTKIVHFEDKISKVSLDYPASWQRTQPAVPDGQIALVALGPAGSRLSLRVAQDAVAAQSHATQRRYTALLLAQDPRIKQIVHPVAVRIGGLPAWRYRYTLGSGDLRAAHDHYFIFKGQYMLQLVFEASPPESLPTLAPIFDAIAASFRGTA